MVATGRFPANDTGHYGITAACSNDSKAGEPLAFSKSCTTGGWKAARRHGGWSAKRCQQNSRARSTFYLGAQMGILTNLVTAYEGYKDFQQRQQKNNLEDLGKYN